MYPFLSQHHMSLALMLLLACLLVCFFFFFFIPLFLPLFHNFFFGAAVLSKQHHQQIAWKKWALWARTLLWRDGVREKQLYSCTWKIYFRCVLYFLPTFRARFFSAFLVTTSSFFFLFVESGFKRHKYAHTIFTSFGELYYNFLSELAANSFKLKSQHTQITWHRPANTHTYNFMKRDKPIWGDMGNFYLFSFYSGLFLFDNVEANINVFIIVSAYNTHIPSICRARFCLLLLTLCDN